MAISSSARRLPLWALTAAIALGIHGAAAQAPTQTRLSLSSETSVIGQPVTLTAILDAGDQPALSGQIQFRDGDEAIGTADLEAIGIEAAQVAAGTDHSCALTTGGQVHCWGSNAAGQLGDGTSEDRTEPVAVAGLAAAVSVAAGAAHSCAALTTGEVMCWGSNQSGQLGDGTGDDRTGPVPVVGITDAIAVAAGQAHGCALLGTGHVQCWGANDAGQLGDGSTSDRMSPVAVGTLGDAVAFALGAQHSCAMLDDGALRCWGANANGQLGDGTQSDSASPVAVGTISDAVSLSAGASHACAARDGGEVACWGANAEGQLGDGGQTDSATPVTVGTITDAVAVAAGTSHSCAARETGGLWCWGSNAHGQLGDGTQTDSADPVAVGGIDEAVAVAAGGGHGCALSASAELQCWGRNDEGQLGDGSQTDRADPTPVAALILESGARAVLQTSTLPEGLRALTAAFPGIEGHAPSTSAVQFHLVHAVTDRAAQHLTFDPVPDQTFATGGTVPLVASSSAGLPVSFASLTPEHCSAAEAEATMLATGLCRIEAMAEGTDDFLPAVPQRREFTITTGAQTITFAEIPDQGLLPDATVALEASAGSGLLVVFSSQTPETCTVSGAEASLLALGTCTIAANQAGNDNYAPAPEVTRSFTILPGTTLTLTGPETSLLGESVTFEATLASEAGTPTGTVSFRFGDQPLGSIALDAEGVASLTTAALPLGTHEITARYAPSETFGPALSEPLSVTVRVLEVGFVGGGAVFRQTEACEPVLGEHAHAVTVRYSPSELGGLPSGISIVWPEGSEHLARWGAMSPNGAFLGAAGRQSWSRFVFYPTRPRMRVVYRQITSPEGATDLEAAQELVLRVRAQNFAATPGCSVTIAATLLRPG